MDRLIYTAMTGAKHVFMQQAGTANNLANASTIGFKAQEHRFRAVPVLGEGMPTRAFTVDASVSDVMELAADNVKAAPGDRLVTRYVCVHGHFYQPPRENPWLDEIEPQPSAAPFPDWNARITAECYRPNTAARIVDGHGDIIAIVDNYARMSWNVGPTLFTWMARHAPDVHAALVAADRASVAALGHGAALAQAHGHLIMPLCTPRDRQTQVRWGLADFRHRFRDVDCLTPNTVCLSNRCAPRGAT